MSRELLMQNNYEWGTKEGKTIETDKALNCKARNLKIEGQTYQNLSGVSTAESSENKFYKYEKITGIKSSTTYTWIFDIKSENTLTTGNVTEIVRIDLTKEDGNQSIPCGFTGTVTNVFQRVKLKFTTPSANIKFIEFNLRNQFNVIDSSLTSNTITIKNNMLLEGDYTNTDLPILINGIESVAEREFEQNLYTEGDLNVKGKVVWYNVKKYVAVKPNTTYTFSCNIESVNKGDYNAKPFIEIYTNEKLPSNKNINLSESGSASFTTNNEAKQLIIYFFVNNEKYSSTECEANFKNIAFSWGTPRNQISIHFNLLINW